MSLNRSEKETTAQELRAHLRASGLSEQELATWLGLPQGVVETTLRMDDAPPAAVWLVRDALDQAVAQVHGDGGGWTVLTEAARRQAQRWFPLRAVPPRA